MANTLFDKYKENPEFLREYIKLLEEELHAIRDKLVPKLCDACIKVFNEYDNET